MEPTMDPTVNIVERGENYKEYLNTQGERWRIFGTCNACGLCEMPPAEIPSVVNESHRIPTPDGEVTWNRTLRWNAQPGTPLACFEDNHESRLDSPLRPDFVNELDGCALTGEWVDGN